MAVLLEDIAKFATSTTAGELNQGLKQLSTDSENIATALGGNISATDIEDLIIGAAIEYYDRLKALGPNATETEYNAALKAAVKAVYTSNISGNAKYENLVAVFFRNISLAEVEKVLGEVAAKADPGAEARKAFARAIKRVEDGSQVVEEAVADQVIQIRTR